MQPLFFTLILLLHQHSSTCLTSDISKKTSQQIRLQIILRKYKNLGLPIDDLKPGKLTLPKEPDHSHPDLRRHTNPQNGVRKRKKERYSTLLDDTIKIVSFRNIKTNLFHSVYNFLSRQLSGCGACRANYLLSN